MPLAAAVCRARRSASRHILSRLLRVSMSQKIVKKAGAAISQIEDSVAQVC